MGVSTDGILFFGILLPEDSLPPWAKPVDSSEDNDDQDDYDDEDGGSEWSEWEEHFASLINRDLKKPDVEYNAQTKAIYKKYWAEKRETVQKAKCSIESHCSGDSPMYLLTHKELYFSANRGYPISFEKGLPEVKAEQIDDIRLFCLIMKIEYTEPKWHLCSMWS